MHNNLPDRIGQQIAIPQDLAPCIFFLTVLYFGFGPHLTMSPMLCYLLGIAVAPGIAQGSMKGMGSTQDSHMLNM